MDKEELKRNIIEYVKDAVKYYKFEEYEKAMELYLKASKGLFSLSNKEENVYSKRIYIEKAKEYCSRVRKIREDALEEMRLQKELNDFIVKKKQRVKWDDIVGLEEAKEILKEATIYPKKFPQLFKGKRKPWKTILLYGPPHTGKSHLVKAVVTETKYYFISISFSKIINEMKEEPNIFIKDVFFLARKNEPSIIFFDEVDRICSSETDIDYIKRIEIEFRIQIENTFKSDENILIIGATNNPWELNPIFRKIFQKKIYISLPRINERKDLFDKYLKDIPNTLTEEQKEDIVKRTDWFSAHDIITLIKDANLEQTKKYKDAEYFKKIPGINENTWNYVPCQKNEEDAIKMIFSEIPDPKDLLPPKAIYEDFIVLLKKMNGNCINQNDYDKYEEFTIEFGQEG